MNKNERISPKETSYSVCQGMSWHVISWVQSGIKAFFKLIKSTVLVQLVSAVFWQDRGGGVVTWKFHHFLYLASDLLHIALLWGLWICFYPLSKPSTNLFLFMYIFHILYWQCPHCWFIRDTRHYATGFSLTFEVEGHWLVSRQVPCETEGRGPETVGGSRGMLPWKIFRT